MNADPDDLKRIRAEIDQTLAADKPITTVQMRREYTALANRNKTLILRFTRRAQWTLVILTVGMFALGGEALKLTVDIQNSRVNQCEMGNERHVNTEIELEKTIEELPPKLRKQAIQQKKGTERLLNAAVPLRDCSKI